MRARNAHTITITNPNALLSFTETVCARADRHREAEVELWGRTLPPWARTCKPPPPEMLCGGI